MLLPLLAAAALSSGFLAVPEEPLDHVTEAERREIWRAIDASRARLPRPKAGVRPAFRWPLRAARGYSQPGFYRVPYFVDHDGAFPGALRDFTCGMRTYDVDGGYNHQGTDISIFPDNWNTMAARQVEIVAAAPGTIAFKADGNDDRSCRNETKPWNAVYIEHDDGSIAWYGHMKTGSVTTKPVGARVEAGEYLGNVGSSGNSAGPHLHFEVYDANQRLIDPFAGTCNAKNAESWWIAQPSYFETRVNRAITASGAVRLPACGADGRNADPGSIFEKTAFAPGETVFFTAAIRDIQPGMAAQYTVRRPDGSVWRSHAGGAATAFASGSYDWVSFALDADAPTGTWMLEIAVGGSRAEAAFDVAPGGAAMANRTDPWWNRTEPGWGVNLNHQGDVIFATWFTYDDDGAGMWLVLSDARLGADGAFAGTIYRATGTPLHDIGGSPAANFPLPAVGQGSFRFTSNDAGVFRYTVNGITQEKAIERQSFSTPATCRATAGSRAAATNYQDLWWNAAEPGWGINLAHQGEVIFATWFTYGAGGRGQWLVASEARRQPTGEYRGRLYRTTGTPFGAIAGAPATTAPPADVGEITLAFADGENARLDYVVDGIARSKQVTRQAFAGTRPLCR